MSALQKLMSPLRRAVAAFFRHDLALRRDTTGLQIVLEPKVEDAAKPNKKKGKKASREELALHKDKHELALILEQLGSLLAEVPETRAALRHLVFVEHALNKKGLRALHKLPLDVLQRALEQLEGLVTNWSPVGLASLRSKMAVAIIDREYMDPEAESDAYRTAAVMDPSPAPAPEVQAVSDDDALAAAYAALGPMGASGASGPSGDIELQGELGSRSTRSLAPPVPRASDTMGDIRLRELQS